MPTFIRNNPASYAVSLGSLVFVIFMSTFGGGLAIPAIIMFMLTFTGLVFGPKFGGDSDEAEPNEKKFQEIAVLGMFGLMTFLILSIFIPQVWFQAGQTIQIQTFLGVAIPPLAVGAIYSAAWTSAFFFAVGVVPPAEEQFFRVLIGNVAAKFAGDNPLFFAVMVPLVGAVPVVTMSVVGLVFSTFHLAAYGLNWVVLTILWGAGSILYYIDLRAGDPLPSIFAHAGNNALSFIVGGNILAPYFPTITPIVTHPLLLMAIPLGMLLLTEYRKGTRFKWLYR